MITLFSSSDTPPTLLGELPVEVTPFAVSHRQGCPNGKPGWPDERRTWLDVACREHGCCVGYLYRFFPGRVVALRERNMYDDSDFYARVWHRGRFREVEYASTRGWTYFNGATVDADALTSHAWLETNDFRSVLQDRLVIRRRARLAELRENIPVFGQAWRVKSKRSKIPCGTLVEVTGDIEMSGYASSLSRFPAEAIEERWAERPSDIRVPVRVSSGESRWISGSCLERA
jgi:hypothetical protein